MGLSFCDSGRSVFSEAKWATLNNVTQVVKGVSEKLAPLQNASKTLLYSNYSVNVTG